MKELSIEEKAKAYDDLLVKLQKAKEDNDVCDDRYCCVIDAIVPELTESEDERIRKELLEHCKNQAEPYIRTGNKCPQIQSWIDWLEKQGEQKEIDYNEELKKCKTNPLYFFDKYVKVKFKEHEHNWSENDEKMMRYVIGSIDTNISDSNFKNIRIWFESLKNRVQPKSHWKPSAEQMKFLWKYAEQNNYDGTILTSLYNDIKKLREE